MDEPDTLGLRDAARREREDKIARLCGMGIPMDEPEDLAHVRRYLWIAATCILAKETWADVKPAEREFLGAAADAVRRYAARRKAEEPDNG